MTSDAPRTSRRQAFLLAVASTAMLLSAQEPVAAGWLAFVALVPFCLLLEMPSEARPARALYLGGLLYFLVGCWWLKESSPVNLVLMTIPEALSFPGAWIVARALRARSVPAVLAAPCGWVALEWLRSMWPFNGFPWLVVGNALVNPLELAQLAEWGGVLFLSFLAALTAAVLASAWRLREARPVAIGVAILALHVPVLMYAQGAKRIREVREALTPGPKVIAIQANIPQELKRAGASANEIAGKHVRLTRAALEADTADLVIWPETMVPGTVPAREGREPTTFENHMAYGSALIADVAKNLLAPRSAHGLFGVLAVDGDRVLADPTTNSALYVSPRGERIGMYSKTVLVPGGEFVPLRGLLGFAIDPIVRSIAGIVPALVPGGGPSPFELPTFDGRRFRFGTTICYENVYSEYCVESARGVDFVINLSNEAWFKESFEFDQMDAASRLRAIETRRSLVRATNSGISAVYGPTGERLAVVVDAAGKDRAVEGVLRAEVPIYRGETAFSRAGAGVIDGLFGFVLAVVVLLGVVGRYRARRAR